jgi:hypothetical protein
MSLFIYLCSAVLQSGGAGHADHEIILLASPTRVAVLN